MDQAEEDLKRMKITGWRVKAEDRQEWSRTVEQTKTHPGLYSQQKKKKNLIVLSFICRNAKHVIVFEFFHLLVYYAVYGSLIPTFRDYLLILSSWTAWALKMGLISSPETSTSNHRTPRDNPEDGRTHFNHGESLRPRIHFICVYIKTRGKMYCARDTSMWPGSWKFKRRRQH